MRVVLDTNVLISALFWSGPPRRLVDLAAAGHYQVVTSPDLLAELEAVLVEDFGAPQDRVEFVLRDILSYAEVVTAAQEIESPVRDAADVKVIACAISGSAECIVTGDQDLLALGSVGAIRVLSVRDFLDLRRWPG